jgi:hypothetical protein
MYNNPIGATISFDGQTTNLKNFKKADHKGKKLLFVQPEIVLFITIFILFLGNSHYKRDQQSIYFYYEE